MPFAGPRRSRHIAGFLWGLLAVAALWLGQAGQAGGAGIRLTDGSAYGGTFGRFSRISPDGTRVVFTADTAGGEVAALYSVPITGGSPVQLHAGTIVPENYRTGPLGEPTWWYGKSVFEIAPDGGSVIYSAEPSVGSVDLYRAPIAGGPSVHLASLSGAGVDTLAFHVAPDAGHVVFRVNWPGTGDTEQTTTIYSVPAAGGEAPVTLFAAPASGHFLAIGGDPWYISPDSGRVMFADASTLYITDIGGGPVTTLASAGAWYLSRIRFTPDGSRVLFTTFWPPITSHMTSTLYSVGVAGGSPVELVSTLSGPGPAPKGVQNGRVATIGSTAIITACTSSGVTEFRRVAIDTGASTLMGTIPADTERSLFLRAALHDASGAAFEGLDDSEAMSLWYIPFSGEPAVRLTDDIPPAESYPEHVLPYARCLITPDDRTLVYSIPTTNGREVYSVAISGGASVRLDHDPSPGLYVLDSELTPDGRHVLYTVCEPYTGQLGTAYHIKGLYAVDVRGGTPWLLNDPLAPGDFIAWEYQIGPDGTVVYWAGNDETGYDLYASAIPEPASLALLALAGLTLVRRRP